MEPTEQLAHILPTLSSTVDRILVTQLSDPTPCTNFTVHDVLNHMIVAGGTFAQSDDPSRRCRSIERLAAFSSRTV